MPNKNGNNDPEILFIDRDGDAWRQCNAEWNEWVLLSSSLNRGVTFTWLIHEYGPGTVAERGTIE